MPPVTIRDIRDKYNLFVTDGRLESERVPVEEYVRDMGVVFQALLESQGHTYSLLEFVRQQKSDEPSTPLIIAAMTALVDKEPSATNEVNLYCYRLGRMVGEIERMWQDNRERS